MAVVLVGGVCVLAVGFLIFMSVLSAVFRMFAGGGYNRGGYQGSPRQGWGFHRGWGAQIGAPGYGPQQAMPHHPKPKGGGFASMFGSTGHKPRGGHQNKSHFGGGGAHKKW